MKKRAILLSVQRASIYTKDTDLDKSKYDSKQAEDEQLIAYYKNYMNDDKLSEEERAMYRDKVDKLNASRHQRISREEIDPSQIKTMLETMVQIDSDPDSEKAKQYYQQLAEVEKGKKNRATQHITIKTHRGRHAE